MNLERDLSVRTVDDATIYPTIRVASRPDTLLMGVFDKNGQYVEGTALDRRSGERGAPMPAGLFPDVTAAEAPEAIYAGTLYFHFGHFLLESLARTWYAARHPELPLVWAGAHDWQTAEFRPWQQEILELLGLRNPVVIAADPIRFGRLHVPDVGYRYDDTFHPQHARFLGRYVGPPQQSGTRLWLSRSQVGTDVRDLNAAATERRLTEAGWRVTDPGRSTVREQLDQLSRAEVVAGEEGSAFHTLMLLQDLSDKRFVVFRRHGSEHRNLQTIGDARGVNQQFHSLRNERVLSAAGRAVTKVSPNSAEVLDRLGVPVPARPSAPAAKPTRTEAALAIVLGRLGPGRLLDVGTTKVELLLGSSAEARVAVSPSFGFDPRSYADTGIEFFELELDRYLDWFAADQPAFDVIRIAAENYQQFVDSFHTSKGLAGPDTTWLLGCGDRAARVAGAIRLTEPGFAVRRWLAGARIVYTASRVPGAPTTAAEAGEIPLATVKRRLRRTPIRPVR